VVVKLSKSQMSVCALNGVNSEILAIYCDVPQGSILGPTLFILYVNDMCNASVVFNAILFADDTNLFYSGDDLKTMCEIVSSELDKLNDWFKVNKLSLNLSKTSYMIFGNKKSNFECSIEIDKNVIERVNVTKFLGCYIDSKLTWCDHIKYIKNKIAKNLSIMYKVKHVLDSEAMRSLYCAIISPYLNYCCEIWGNNYTERIKTLVIIQKKTIRLVSNVWYRDHTSPLFKKSNILKFSDMINLNTVCILYKAYKQFLPVKLLQFLAP